MAVESTVQPFSLPDLDFESSVQSREGSSVDLVSDVELDLRIELGHTMMSLDEVLRLRPGSVIALDAAVDQPVNIYANEQLIARGEVMVMDDKFCIRVTELVGAA